MFFIYQLLILIGLIFLPLIYFIRLIKKKENFISFSQKLAIPSKKRIPGKLIWFHGASVGELMSIIPLVKQLEKNDKIKNILVTTSTLSSYKIFKKLKFRKTFHQFFPVDFYFLVKRFLSFWKPNIAIFIDSEIWPSMFKELNNRSIKLLLMNARITENSFNNWKKFDKFGKKIFSYITKAYPQNNETIFFLKKLGVKNLKILGNLKYSNLENVTNLFLKQKEQKKFRDRLIFCAASTHYGEEEIIAKSHIELKKKYNNLLTVIIPRHIIRTNQIKKQLDSLKLNSIIRTSNKELKKDTDIYIVDTFGETKKFFKLSNIVFMGGSLIKHGGQNPIEAARFGMKIMHGPNIKNFTDIYKLFKKKRITYEVNAIKDIVEVANKFIKNKKKNDQIINKLGEKILKNTTNEINNEIKKT